MTRIVVSQVSSRTTKRGTVVFVLIIFLVGLSLTPAIVRVQGTSTATADVARATVYDWRTYEETSSDLSMLLPAQPPLTSGRSSGTLEGKISTGAVQQPQQHEFASASSGINFYWVGATDGDPADLSNSGARSVIQVINASVPAGCLSFWVADNSAANIWGQVGYMKCDVSTTPFAFYEIWNLTSGEPLGSGQTSVSIGYHEFSMYSQGDSTTWAFALDGTVFGTHDMLSSVSMWNHPVQALSEEGMVSAPYDPPQVGFSTAIQVLKSGSWRSSQRAGEQFGCGTSLQSCWGVAGNLQDPSIPINSMIVGGSTLAENAGTLLWNSPDFTISASPPSPSGNTGTALNSTITISPVNGFTGTVTLTHTVPPSNSLTCDLSTTIITGGSGSSTLSCTASTSGFFTVVVAGTSGELTHTVSVSYTYVDLPAGFLLVVNTPSQGVLVTIDGRSWTTDSSKRISVQVENGTHVVFVQSTIPITIGSISFPIGLANAFAAWNDGVTDNPREVAVSQDTTLTAVYRTTIQPPFYALTGGVAALVLVLATLLHKRRRRHPSEDLRTEGGLSMPLCTKI